MPFDHLAGDHPVGQVAASRDLHRPQDGEIDVTATDHGKRVSARKEACPLQCRHGLFTGIDQVGVDLFLCGRRTDTKQAILRLQRHRNPGRI